MPQAPAAVPAAAPAAAPARSGDATGALVRAESAEERAYERTRRQIAARRRRLGERQAELAVLQAALRRFEDACRARVGDLLAELRRVDSATADYRRRLERLDPSSPEPPEPPEGEAAPDADAEAEADPEPDRFAPEDGGEEPGAGGGPGPGGYAAGGGGDAAPRPGDGGGEAEVKRLYLDLARRCHPDFARGEEDRRRRETLMQRINGAFRDRDLAALRALWLDTEADDPRFGERPVAERLAWARAERARLDARLAGLAADLARLRGHDLHRVWLRHEAGEPALDELADDLRARLAEKGRRLDRLIAAYLRAEDERLRRRGSRSPRRARAAR